jgi:hypothetical protein
LKPGLNPAKFPKTNKEFAEHVVNMLMDESPEDENNTRWGKPFDDIFEEIMEDHIDCVKYNRGDD